MKRYQTGTVNILMIVSGVAAIVILGLILALNQLHTENSKLLTKNGELAGQVKDVSDKNDTLNKQLNLQEILKNTATKESEVYEKQTVEIKKEAEVQKRSLPRVIVKEKDTKPTVEQQENTAKRLDVLWVAYCGQVEDQGLCPVENSEKGKV